jgi:AraC-like DNA-binding protein
MVRALADGVERAGGSRERFLSEAGLAPDILQDASAWLPLRDYARVLRAAVDVSGDPAFGLHFGERMSTVVFDVVGTLLLHASTLRECILGISRYSRLVAEGYEPVLLESGDTATVRFAALRGGSAPERLTAEFVMYGMLRATRQFVGERVLPTRVGFTYPAPDYVADYERAFGGAQRFDQPFTELAFPSAWLDKAQLHHSPDLYDTLKTHAERSLGRLERDTVVTDRIRKLLESSEPNKLPNMEGVARELGMSGRSLRRRLVEEGSSFGALLEGRRVTAAKRLLENPELPIQEVAHTMGFATPAAFHHAFKRWTGMTPKQYRATF